jgi:hypothetical protein
MKGITDATPIRECRVCGNGDLVKVLDLGSQAATGMFPKSAKRVADYWIGHGSPEILARSAGTCGLPRCPKRDR